MMSHGMYRDNLTIIKANGEEIEDVKGSVQKSKIFIQRSDILIEASDRIVRTMSNGGVEEYEVIDPGFHEGLGQIKPGYQMDVKKVTLAQTDDVNGRNEDKLKNKVFIVHGHDETAKLMTARFVEKLGLKAIILHEQASSGRTIIEKIEHYSDVGFAIVLYTPDDVGSVKSNAEELKGRARQNVVFEHGYLVGKLGRKNVAALVRKPIELPNDVSGVVYINMNEADWQYKLVIEMKNSEYEIDANRLI